MTERYILNGADFSNLAEFYDSIGDLLLPNEFWGKNLDALNDILSGGFNIPNSPFELVWENIEKSKIDLGIDETIRWYETKIFNQEDNREYIKDKITELKGQNGETLYNLIFEILAENSIDKEIGVNCAIFRM